MRVFNLPEMRIKGHLDVSLGRSRHCFRCLAIVTGEEVEDFVPPDKWPVTGFV